MAVAAALVAWLALPGVPEAEAAPTFRWPWAGSEGWRYTQGFHSDYALDFQPQIAANCDSPVDLTHTIRPVAPGTVVEVRLRGAPQPPLPVGLVIDHGGGWSSYYTHLANVPAGVATVGSPVGYATNLGNPSCYSSCPGGVGTPCASGRHIHFRIMKDGAGSAIVGRQICGWTVGADSGLTRNAKTHYPKKSATAPISNTGCPAGTPAPPPTPVEPPSEPAEPPPVAGDADCNGITNAIDVLLLLQADAGMVPPPACQQLADVDGDGVITVIDAAIVLQYVAGVLAFLPPAA